MSINEFYNSAGTTAVAVNTQPVPQPDIPTQDDESWNDLSLWGKTGRLLQMPVGVVYTGVEAVGKTIRNVAAGKSEYTPELWKNLSKQAWRTATLKESHSFQEVFNRPESIGYGNVIGKVVGLGADIMLDPTVYVTGGLTKAGKAAKSMSGLTKEAKMLIAAGEDTSMIYLKTDSTVAQMARAAQKAGKPTEFLATKLEQARAGQKGLKFFGKSVAPTWFNVGWENMKSYMGGVAKATKVPTLVRKVFSTSSGNKVADTIETVSRDTINFRNSLITNRVKGLMPMWNKLKEKSQVAVTKALENGNLVKNLSNEEKVVHGGLENFRTMLTNLRNKGYLDDILRDEPATIIDWFPHVQKQIDSVPFFQKVVETVKDVGKAVKGKMGEIVGETETKVARGGGKVHGVPKSVEATRGMDWLTPVENVSGKAERVVTIPEKGGFTAKKYVEEVAKVEAEASRKMTILSAKRDALKVLTDIPGNADKEILLKNLRKLLPKGKGVAKDIETVPLNEFLDTISKLKGEKGFELDQKITNVLLRLKNLADNPEMVNETVGTFVRGVKGVDEEINIIDRIAKLDKEIINVQNSIVEQTAKFPKQDIWYTKKVATGKEGKFVEDIYIKERANVFEKNKAIAEWNIGRAANEKIPLFETNPLVAFTQRGMDISKGVTSREYINQMRQFGKSTEDAPVNWQTVSLKDGKMIQGLEDLRFDPEIVKNINKVYEGFKPEQVKWFVKNVLAPVGGVWRAQALVSSAYHFRNFISNKWSNFLAGVNNPQVYFMAKNMQMGKDVKFVDGFGREWTTKTLMDAARKNGVLNLGQTAQEVSQNVLKDIRQSTLAKYNPLNTENLLFQTNRNVGTAIENNDRLAHFIGRMQLGDAVPDAAASVKKYLFDYSDLTQIEKDVFKNVTLFYTWTRKNIPLQLREFTQQPGKFSSIFKAETAIEESAGAPPNEKFLNEYIKDNAPIRIRTTEDGITEYFLLGNWLPAAQAITFLEQPTANLISMVSPYFKIGIELFANKSLFFTGANGEPSKLETTAQNPTNFLGLNIRGKTANIIRNIRILNDLNRMNPGQIFGGKGKPAAIQFDTTKWPFIIRKPVEMLEKVVGPIAPAQESKAVSTLKDSELSRVLNYVLGGQMQKYNPAEQAIYDAWSKKTSDSDLMKTIRKTMNTPYGKKLLEKYRESLQNR